MCGIIGAYYFKRKPDITQVKSAMTAIAHRGPDGEGNYLHDNVALGHRRLSIIDIEGGSQPIFSADKKFVIVYNGELYNYKELRNELKGKGFVFNTNTDTEVILNAYIAYKSECLNKFNGIFAFAILNLENKSLFIARDQLGVKPLYYTLNEDGFCFASEIKALFKLTDINKQIDSKALEHWLTYRHVPAPMTMIEGVEKLKPGCFAEFANNKLSISRYYSLVPKIMNKSFDECVLEYQQKLELAVKAQMMADVPLGLMLSGGIDSALIGMIMTKYATGSIKSFSFGFEESGSHNELTEARTSAKLIGTDHYEIILNAKDYLDLFYESFNHLEEPISTTSSSAVHAIAKIARQQNVKVLMSGQGADETLAGYKRHLAEKYYPLLSFLVKTPLLKNIFNGFSNEKIRRTLYSMDENDGLKRLTKVYSIFTEEMKKQLLPHTSKSSDASGIIEDWYNETKHLDRLARIQYIDARNDLPDNLLIIADKMSMASSVELRVPFLDIELFNYLESVPSEYKIKGLTTKYFQKKAAEKWLPASVINRAKKGFETPLDKWFKSNLGDTVRSQITSKNSACSMYFNVDYINKLINHHQQGISDYHKNIFSLWAFETWYQQFYLKL